MRLSEEHWDDPEQLHEILAELRQRDESEASHLARSIARRLSALNVKKDEGDEPAGEDADKQKKAAAEEKDAAEEIDDEAEDRPLEDEPEADPAPDTKRRRKIFAVIGASCAAAVVAAAILWPRDQPPPVSGEAAKPGLQLAGKGERPDPNAQEAAAPGSAVRLQLEPVAPVQGAHAPAEASAPANQRRQPAPAVPQSRAAARNSGFPSVAGIAKTGPQEPLPRETHIARLEPVIPAERLPPPPAAPPLRVAEDGVRIGEGRLKCYLTDNRPDSCVAMPDSSTRPLTDPDFEELQRDVRERAGVGDSGGRTLAVSPPIDRPVSSSFFRRPSSLAAAGTAPPQEIRKPSEPPQAAVRITPPLSPSCVAPPRIGRVVFILDGSLSMGLPLDVDAELEDRLDEGVLRRDPEARRQYRALLAKPGPKRITRAREAFTAAVDDLPEWIDLGLVVFRECRDIRQVGVFDARERSDAVAYVRSLIPRGRTPIADSLRSAAELLDDGPSSIVLLTDGREFCGGDPCAAAAEIKAAHPDTQIHVVDMTGQAKAECIAKITGGHTYTPSAADDLARVVRNAFRGADASCPAPAAAPPR